LRDAVSERLAMTIKERQQQFHFSPRCPITTEAIFPHHCLARLGNDGHHLRKTLILCRAAFCFPRIERIHHRAFMIQRRA
jgi:hypothetical protein